MVCVLKRGFGGTASVIGLSLSSGTVSKGHPQAYLYQESMLVVSGISYKYFLPTGCTNNLL
jgi:hypothetical protein